MIIAQLELLLPYSERFFQRQFITRKIASHEILTKLEDMLTNYFNSGALAQKGLPGVTYCRKLKYLSRLPERFAQIFNRTEYLAAFA